ncbi:MAG: ABC transporter ATP-binding protein [Sulfolobaceae archaeon]
MVRKLHVGSTKLLEIRNLKVYFTRGGILSKKSITKAVDGVNLEIGKGEILGLVGESGSGKTTLGKASIGLIKPTQGNVILYMENEEIDITRVKGKKWRELRSYLQMVYQDPYSSIDPYMRVYDTLRIPLQYHGIKSKEEVNEKIRSAMEIVGLPEELLDNYVFQLSGGQRQRLSIARAIILDPKYIVADEPVTMLDVSLKGEILKVIDNIRNMKSTSFLLITHEIPVAKVISDRIAIMYAGKVLEIGDTEELINNPLHPYTQALIEAYPKIRPERRNELIRIRIKDELIIPENGCRFYPRCPFALDKCKLEEPKLVEVKKGHYVACWLY